MPTASALIPAMAADTTAQAKNSLVDRLRSLKEVSAYALGGTGRHGRIRRVEVAGDRVHLAADQPVDVQQHHHAIGDRDESADEVGGRTGAEIRGGLYL